MIKYLLILTIFLPTISFGQKLSDSVLSTLYNKTIKHFFTDTLIHQDQKKYGYVIMQTDIDSSMLLKNIGQNHFKYFTHKTPRQATCKGDKPDNGRHIYNIYHNQLTQDTIEIIIGGSIVIYRDDIYSDFLFSTQSLMDILAAKYNYDKSTNKWTYISSTKQNGLNRK